MKKPRIDKNLLNKYYPTPIDELEMFIIKNKQKNTEFVQSVTEIYIIKCIKEQHEYGKIEDRLVELGLSHSEATKMFSNAREKLANMEDFETSKRKIFSGIGLIVIGVILSLIIRFIVQVAGGGYYLVFIGIIAFGIYYLLSGIIGVCFETNKKNDSSNTVKKTYISAWDYDRAYLLKNNSVEIKKKAHSNHGWLYLIFSFFPPTKVIKK